LRFCIFFEKPCLQLIPKGAILGLDKKISMLKYRYRITEVSLQFAGNCTNLILGRTDDERKTSQGRTGRQGGKDAG
ncbi:MAG: hypothetical protein ACI406_06195, partial [Victivallis vadensis]